MSGWLVLVIVSVPLMVLELAALVDVVFRRPDLAAGRRVAWATTLVLVPYISVLIYVVARPPRHGHPSRRTARSDEPTAEALVAAAERHVRGELDDAGFERAVVAARATPN